MTLAALRRKLSSDRPATTKDGGTSMGMVKFGCGENNYCGGCGRDNPACDCPKTSPAELDARLAEALGQDPPRREPPEEPTEDDDPTIVYRALSGYANWIETNDFVLSARDVAERGRPRKAIGPDQARLIERLRTMAEAVLKDVGSNKKLVR